MRIAVESFRGEAPRLTPRALPDNAAQLAINTRLQSGDLETWRGFLETKTLQNSAVTIYLLNDEWLSWESDVDVARGPIPGDTTYRTYLTGPDEYTEPRFTTYALATTGSEPFPVSTRPVGVPAPVSDPTLVVSVDVGTAINILDGGDSLTTSWVTSSTTNTGLIRSQVSQSVSQGNPAPSYELAWENNAGVPAYAYRNFGVEGSSAVSMELDFMFTSGDNTYQQLIAHLANTETGQGLGVSYDSDSDTLGLIIASGWSSIGSSAIATQNIGALAFDQWYHLSMSMSFNADGTKTATASIYLGSGLIGTVTGTGSFTSGGYCGFVTEGTASDALDEFRTYFDNIDVSGSGNNDPTIIATSYVYTFVNDLGEESAPSPASATVRRSDGVAVTVSTATQIPSGISSTYGIATKRIYRAATGNTGTVFRFVAEIPLATADYEDTLTDAQLGEVLESEEFDLPPNDLRGLIALPNGVLAGFSKNQLCLSAQNRPHAWPVGNRLTTDTDIVAIANIDTTIVIGTESYVYTASGNDPSAYSMSAPGAKQACVSKPSMKYVNEQVGVVFASPDGLMASLGPTSVRNITEGTFTRRQWQDLRPGTIRAVVYDDIYVFAFGDMNSASGGTYMLDLKQTGFGLVRIDFLPTAMFTDPLTDKLYMVQESVATGNWLGYDDGGGFGPIMYDQGIYQALGTPVAFLAGTSFGHTNLVGGDGVAHVPLSGGDAEAPTLVEGVTWFPSNSGDPAPTISTTDPSGGVWTGYTWVLQATHDGIAVLDGPTGVTVITIGITGSPFYYEGATLEYFDTPTPPSATTAVLPYDEPVTVVEDEQLWFTFTLASPTSIDFRTTGAGSYTQIALFAANGALIAEDNASLGFNSEIAAVSLPAGTFYAAVAGEFTTYGFGFTATPSSPTESGGLNVVIEETP